MGNPAGKPGVLDQPAVERIRRELQPGWPGSSLRKKMVEGYMDAYSIASNWPQQSLDRNPLTKIFGRHMIFFHIAMKMEKKNCYKAQMYDWLQTLYGNSDDFNWSQVGLPADKYDRASVAVMVMQQAETKEQMFVKQFFNNNEAMM